MNVILSIDPSGSGTTGVCVVSNDKEFFFQDFKEKNWEKHLFFLFQIIEKEKPDVVLFETTNYIRHKMQSSLDLLKLLGGIVCLKYSFPFISFLESVAVNQVKNYKLKIQNQQIVVDDLFLKAGRGKGWIFRGTKISLHQLDALIIFFFWKQKKEEEKKQFSDKTKIGNKKKSKLKKKKKKKKI